ncbi:hypothetical protein VTL71DRAFT_7075 [Oculimacula yallundae]|uniref:Uncharacterized protein n=1 Tax=Oculimacula yallundae TaxID=86028 RepID=A0ABR4BWH8_9HELO
MVARGPPKFIGLTGFDRKD